MATLRKSVTFRALHMLLAIGTLVQLACTVGCGGLDEGDMRAYAMKRAPDPEDEEPAATPAPASSPIAAAAPATPAAAPPQPTEPEAPLRVATATPVAESTPSVESTNAQSAPRPPLPTTPEDRARFAAANMERVAAAMETYREQKGLYPPVAIRDRSRTALLSWRVELLPYLGYNDLYQQFDKNQPWYAPKNKALLEQIPKEYLSPERGDTKTNLLVPAGGSAIFQAIRTLHENRIEDGLSNTVVLLEVNDELAVPWTQPVEYEVDPLKPKRGLGGLRGGQVFVAWGGGVVGSVSMQSPAEGFKAMVTADGGEPYTMTSLNRPIDFSTVASAGSAAPLDDPGTSATFAGAANGETSARGGGGRRSATPTSQLASTYRAAASAALHQGEATNAWQWYYAALAMGMSPQPEFQWYPALRRPAIGLHFAVGVAIDSAADIRGVRRSDGAKTSLADLTRLTQPYGETLLDVLEQHAQKVSIARHLGADAKQPGRQGRRNREFSPAAAITTLLPGSETQLRRDAMDDGCDVLVMLEVDQNLEGTNRTLRVKLLDLAGRRELYSSRRLGYSSVRKGREGGGDEEELQQVEWELEDLLEDKLSPKTWPVTLNQRIAKQRVESLGASRDPYPPRVVAEIFSYRDQQLVDAAEVLRSLEKLLGDQAGADLLLGSESKRRRVIREWMPSEDAEKLVALAERKRRNDKND